MRKFLYSVFLMAFLYNTLCLNPSAAQEAKGAIAGTVKDSSDSVLTGALVELQPSGKRVVSDTQGQFRITDLAAGEYNLTFSYVGLETSTTTVKVEAGQTASVNGVLKVASVNDQVIVTADRPRGEAEAINIERTADNIVQVLPSKVINSLPNTNIADAVGRLPSVTLEHDEGEGKYVQIRGTEPRLTYVIVNGVHVPSPEAGVRNIKLDVIPADLVDRIEVSKTLSANQDGDAIGGAVNLVTRTAGDRPTYTLSGEGGYTPIQGGRWLDGFSATAGQRFGESKRFGVLLGGAYDRNNRGIDDLEPSPAVGNFNGQNVAFFPSEDLRTYKYYRTRYGFAGGLDYILGANSSIYLKGLYSDFHDFGDTWVYSPVAGSTITGMSGSQLQFSSDGSMVFRHYIRRPDQQIFSVSTGARHDLAKTLITYEFAGSRAHNIGGQDFATTHFGNGPTGITFAEDLSNPLKPKFPVLQSSTPVFDPTTYSITDTIIPRQHSTELDFQGAATLARRYNVGSHFGTLELGVKIRNAHKTENADDHLYTFTGSTPVTLADVLGTASNPGYYGHSYQFGPLSDYNKILQAFNANQSSFTLQTGQDHILSDGATFDANERVYAGYLMNTIGFGKLRIQTGVRIEATDAVYTANKLNESGGAWVSTTPVNGSSNYIDVLPSIQAQYQIERNTNIRAAYAIGISRPNFSDIVPSQQVDPNTSPNPSLTVGNPALKPTTANNYDVLVEHFFQPLGILQAGFFYKSFSDPIYPTKTHIPLGAPQFPGYDLFESINGPSAHIAGFETSWEQRLSFLPGLLNGLGVAANYSYTTSQVTFPSSFSGGRTDHAPLQRQAPNTWNLGMTYDKARFSMRFAVTHNDTSIFSYFYQVADPAVVHDPILGLKGPTGDVYLYSHTQYDIQGSYRLHTGLQVVVSGLNLSNEVFGFYQGSPRYPIQREYYRPSVIFGMRWSSTAE